jgi:LPXTG-motif cell wall-anchored protein
MNVSVAGVKLVACGALVAIGLTVGSGTAHAAPVKPTAEQCASYAQEAITEGETLAQALIEHGLDPAGCPAAPVAVGECVRGHNTVTGAHCYTEGYSDPKDRPAAPVAVGECVGGHNTVTGAHCYTEGYSDPKDRPAGYPVPTATSVPVVDCRDTIDYDNDYDCTPFPVATGESSGAPVVTPVVTSPLAPVVEAVTVSNTAPAAVATATPAKAATVTTPVLAAAAIPAATTAAKTLPSTGSDVSGVVLLALASLGIGAALLRLDKRRRLAA